MTYLVAMAEIVTKYQMRWKRWRFWQEWRIWRKWQKWRTNAKLLTKFQMRWQRVPFESGDFGENGRNSEQLPNC